MNIEKRIKKYRKEVDEILHRYISGYSGIPAELRNGMLYAVFPGGKRFRPVLFLATVEAIGGKPSDYVPFAAAIELVHSFSLVHDDLPSMDNALFRRGKPALHRYIGEAKALLAGDGLLIMAFELASSVELYGKDVDERNVLDAVRELARVSGAHGMTGGQFLDVDIAKHGTESERLLLWVHEHKTAALVRACMTSAAILTGKDMFLPSLYACGGAVGKMFQLIDDILDIEKEDNVNYAKFVGLKRAIEEAREQYRRAVESLSFLGERAELLIFLAQNILKRGEKIVNP